MVVYGGYRFPQGDKRVDAGSGMSGSGDGVREGSGGNGDTVEEVEVLRYHFTTRTWEVLEVQNDAMQPDPRYEHSAVVYNVSHFACLIYSPVQVQSHSRVPFWTGNEAFCTFLAQLHMFCSN